MSLYAASLPQGSPAQRLQMIDAYISSQMAASTLAWPYRDKKSRGEKRKRSQVGNNATPSGDLTTKAPDLDSPFRSLRKRARVSYQEPSESELDSDLELGYISDSSVEWGSRHSEKQPKTKRPVKEKSIKPFPFLSLPTELRNKIYLLALNDPNGVVLSTRWRSHRRTAQRRNIFTDNHCSARMPPERYRHMASIHRQWLSPNLLAVNRQINSEAMAVLYSQPLHFDDTTTLHNFLGPLSNATSSLIRSVTVHYYETTGRSIGKAMNLSALTLLRNCVNLESVRIEWEAMNRHQGNDRIWHGKREGILLARQVYRDGAYWLDTLGADKALQILDVSEVTRKERPWQGLTAAYQESEEKGLKNQKIFYEEELRYLIAGKGKAMKRRKLGIFTRNVY